MVQRLKTGKRCILLLKDAEGFSDAILQALQPRPSSNFQRLEDSFELSLEKYGIKDCEACGDSIHFLNSVGEYEVSVFLLENYDPPILSCALNEVLESLLGWNLSEAPTLVVPFLVASSKLKLENKNMLATSKSSLYGIRFGPVHESIDALASTVHKPPPSLQIYHEQLACFLQLVRFSKMPAYVIIGQHMSPKTKEEFLEVISNVGELLRAFSSLNFVKEKIEWHPLKPSKVTQEPWHALYG